MSHANISNSFKNLGRNARLTLFLDTIHNHVIDDGGAVVWLSAINIDFQLKFQSILI